MATFLTCDTLIAAYKLDAEGWDATNSRLTDFSGFGNHLSIAIDAAPTYATRDGFSCIDFDNTYYFEGEWALPPFFSSVFVGCLKMPSGEGNVFPWAAAVNKDAADNHLDDIELSDSEFVNTTYLRKSLMVNNNIPRAYQGALQTSGSAWTNDQMNIFTCAWSRQPHGQKASTGTEDPVTGEFTTNNSASVGSSVGQFFRLGQLKGTLGALTVGNYLSGKRLYFFRGDVFDHADYAAMRAAEITAWGI